jgi:hypothetical protein
LASFWLDKLSPGNMYFMNMVGKQLILNNLIQ